MDHNSISFLFQHVGNVYSMLPNEDQEKLKAIWMGYAGLAANEYLDLWQTSYSKGLSTAHHRFNRLWRNFVWWYEQDLKNDPVMEDSGRAAANFVWSWEDERINCTWDHKTDSDRLYWGLRSEADERVNLYYEFTFANTVTGDLGGLVGYYNSYERHLNNSIFTGYFNENLILGIGTNEGSVLLTSSGPVLELNEEYTIVTWYDAIARQLRAEAYHASNMAPVSTQAIGVSGVLTLAIALTGTFVVDQFGLSNIDLHNHIEDFYHEVGLIVDDSIRGSSGYVSKLRYMDPTIHEDIYSIPSLQSQIDTPILTLTEAVTGDYWRYGSALWFKEYPPQVSSMWARNTYYSNRLLEDNFGSLVNYYMAPKSYVTQDYLNGIKGLFFSYFGGPTIANIERGVKIVLNLPLLGSEAVVTKIEIHSIFENGWVAI